MKEEQATLLRMREVDPEPGPDEHQVLDYLSRHPDFFMHHEQILCELELPHRAGAAVSLVERQVSLLRERNIDSRQRLNRLLETARDNDLLFARTRRLILALLEADSLNDLGRGLVEVLRREFGIEHGRLVLLASEDHRWPQGADTLDYEQAAATLKGLLRTGRPLVGPLRPQERELLFGASAEAVLSAAIVPVGIDRPQALLVLGSSEARRFHGEMGTLFLEFIGEALQRLLPRLQARS